jgi:hypothetical protein
MWKWNVFGFVCLFVLVRSSRLQSPKEVENVMKLDQPPTSLQSNKEQRRRREEDEEERKRRQRRENKEGRRRKRSGFLSLSRAKAQKSRSDGAKEKPRG